MGNRSNKSRKLTLKTNRGEIGDPWAMLALAIVERAARDFRMGPRLGKQHYLSAVNFFESDFYRLCLDVVAAVVPDFRPGEGFLPVGVDLSRKGVVNRAPAPLIPAQADFFGSGVHDCE